MIFIQFSDKTITLAAKKILFSPIGGTDPISENNFYDGALLHICRVYKPDIVYLYMSGEILNKHKKDNRYIYCLNKLSEFISHEMEIKIIERPELYDVQKFDFIYEDFVGIIKNISDNMDKDDILYFNISSGTPAMKSSLFTINILGEYSYVSVQVNTPIGKMNEHTHKIDDIETLWELNEDNKEKYTNRCKEIYCPAMMKQKKIEIIKKLILEYDYSAALVVAGDIKLENKAMDLLNLANYRINLDLSSAKKIEEKLKINIIPKLPGNISKLFEYTLVSDIKQKKSQYADFLRSISPIITDLFVMIIKTECNLDINDFCCRNQCGALKWDLVKLNKDKKGKKIVVDNDINKNRFVMSTDLTNIILNSSSKKGLKKLVEKIRKVEEKMRNPAAHQIISINDDVIKNRTKEIDGKGFKTEQIIKMIKDGYKYIGVNIKDDYWNSYDEMNKIILEEL